MGARLARSTPLRLALFALLATALVWSSLPSAARVNEFRDAQVLLLYERAAVDTVRTFGELPLWNPYYCGGLDGLGAPQSRFASPTLLVSLLFGPERAQIVLVFLFAVLGMEGMYRWLRLRVVSPAAAAVAAPVFALSGHFAVAFFRGWTNFFGFELVPWILLGITLAVRGRVAGLAIASIAFAIMLGFGGTFAAPLVAVAAVVEGTRALLEQPGRARAQSFVMLFATASFMAAVACVRLWPIAETLAAAPRLMAGTPGHQPRALMAALVGVLAANDGDVDLRGSFFLGAAFIAVMMLGASERRALRCFVIVLIFTWLAAGYARKPALFGLLRELPVFAALRYPERFLWIATIFASEPVAHALARMPLIGEGRSWRVSVWLVLGGAIAFTVATEIRAFDRVSAARDLGSAEDAGTRRPPPFHQARGNRWLATHYEAMGVGSLSCWETHPVAQSPRLRGDLPAEEYLSDDTREAGTVTRVAWSPNRIVLSAALARPARVLVNQNWHPGWHASTGTVVSTDGLLGVDLPAGNHEIVLRFRPWSAIGGASVTLTALAMLGLLAWRTRRHGALFSPARRTGTALCLLLPWAVCGAALAASPDPRWPPPPPRNANGSPAVIDVASEKEVPGAVIGATFDLPLRIEAARVQGPDELGNVAIDVYLRRTAALARTTGMFVHVERRDGQEAPPEKKESFWNRDHQVVAASFYLSDAPEGRLVHDAFGVHLKEPAAGDWDVWVAFGHVSGQRGRATVTNAGAATVSANRVRVGSFVVP